ncbi:hypothetical protein N0V93_004618 [Gnomoniopsis smithogilvyi]|uniref:Uncharacterized protein n=1 Tax=Gnomoniopsis smithogilvyi TaxID=1191159 RepID=A0A9W8YSZ0_9PEZI|nr:hypothetical protein N0V93_004618 [Gnomoniopsis smithogilvyi]
MSTREPRTKMMLRYNRVKWTHSKPTVDNRCGPNKPIANVIIRRPDTGLLKKLYCTFDKQRLGEVKPM